ncbi:MAG TPA: AraC family transcriptional regulator [Chitinophagaceae bacterium]|nr:AraC family transcriptional regulator [Chitinophagaceae bacterium]
MKIEFNHIEPHNLLRPYIKKMWVFECTGKLPSDDLKLIVPNGTVKLTIFSANGITAAVNGKTITAKEGSINLTGVADVPVNLDAEKDVYTQSIGIEFNPKGAYRFFQFNLGEIKNRIYQLGDVIGPAGNQLEEQVINATSVRGKTDVVQQFLIKQLLQHNGDLIFEFCVDKIISSKGKITVKELEKKTGYSSRWLNMKFTERIGVSPKNLSSIIRFSEYYRLFTSDSLKEIFRNEFYEHYYDQSHFIKNFRHFTGFLPSGIERSSNDFGRKFYQM